MCKDLVSVIIPTYNDTDTLYDTIQSVIEQDYSNIEIIVVDDGSDVDLKPLIHALNYHRINYVKLAIHQNANIARNEGIYRSSGQYIAMLDADDRWTKDHIKDCLATIKRHNADGVYGSLILQGEDFERVVIARALRAGESMVDYLLKTGCGAQTSTLFMTKKSAEDILWDPILKRHQDYDFVVRYSKKYTLWPKIMPTVLYRISYQEKDIDYASCISFIKKNRKDISPEVYAYYHKYMYEEIKFRKVDEYYKEYYRKEAMRFC